MSDLRDRIEKRLRAEICPHCREDRPEETCSRTGAGCLLMDRLDDIMDVISGIQDYSLEPYRERIREIVRDASATNSDDDARRRRLREGALDSYFSQIVAIIEQELAADPGLA